MGFFEECKKTIKNKNGKDVQNPDYDDCKQFAADTWLIIIYVILGILISVVIILSWILVDTQAKLSKIQAAIP